MNIYKITGNDTTTYVRTGAPGEPVETAGGHSDGRDVDLEEPDVWSRTSDRLSSERVEDADDALAAASKVLRAAWQEDNEDWVEQEIASLRVKVVIKYEYRVVTDRNVQGHTELVSKHGEDKRRAYVAAQAELAQSVDAKEDTVSYLEDGTKCWVEVSQDGGEWRHDGDMYRVGGTDDFEEAGDREGVPDFDEADVLEYAGLMP